MIKIQPVGAMMIVYPLPKEEKTTDSGIALMEYEMVKAEVIEVSEKFEAYKKGDIVIFPKSEGIGKSIHYQNKSCLWVCGMPFMEGGDIWGKLV